MYYIVMNDVNKGNYEALAGEYEEQQIVLADERRISAYGNDEEVEFTPPDGREW